MLNTSAPDDVEPNTEIDEYPHEACGFALPGEDGYATSREWLVVTSAKEDGWTSASFIDAVDPCLLAQMVNLETIALREPQNVDLGMVAELQEVRILMELDEIGMVSWVESSFGNLKTLVQRSDDTFMLEEIGRKAASVDRRRESDIRYPATVPMMSMRQAMAECEAVGELIETAIEHSSEYEEAEFWSRIARTWNGLADALGLAEAVFPAGDAFLEQYGAASVDLAGKLRPGLIGYWFAKKDARRELAIEELEKRRLRDMRKLRHS